jgi:two-component system sensor histidine kinase MtrB
VNPGVGDVETTVARGRRLGLRNRVAVGFALMALLLSSVLAAAAWFTVSTYLNHQQTSLAVTQTEDNGQLLRLELASGESLDQELLDRLRYPPGAVAVLVAADRVLVSHEPAQTTSVELPASLVRAVRAGAHENQRVTVDRREYRAVGVPLDGGAAFFELHPLAGLRDTLRVLWIGLLSAAVGTTLLGLALGWLASRRLLRPVEQVTEAAAAIAGGDLGARLQVDERQDPDLVELARSFNRTAEALERRVQADIQFAGDVSHELRTPLTTMINSLALVENHRDSLPTAATEPLQMLREDLDRFRRLVLDLLEISRYDDDAGAAEEEAREPLRIGDLVRHAADRAAGRQVTTVEPSARDVVIFADKRRLERMVTNLVQNAEEHGRGCTGVRVAIGEGRVRVEVDDHGPGIPPDRRDRIFARFARGGANGAVGEGGQGVWLGLAIVPRHADWHGGTVSVEDAPGGGARFVVILPVTPVPGSVA